MNHSSVKPYTAMADEIASQTLISNDIQYSHHYNANNSSVKPLTVMVENTATTTWTTPLSNVEQ